MKQLGGIRNILAAVTDAVVLVDSQRRITFMNPEAENLTGFSAEDATGMDLWKICVFLDQSSRKPVTDDIEKILARDGYFNFPVATVIIPGNRETEMLIRGSVFQSDDTRMGSDVIEGVVFRNVSARWMIDTAMQRNQKAESIRILAGGITDNLNDLLTVLLARLSGISRNHADRASVFRSVRDSKKIITRISSMVSSLSPLENTVNFTGKNICFVENALRSSLDIFHSAYPELEIRLFYPDRTGYTAIPAGSVEQTIVNLLMNAGDAVSDNGSIDVTACRVDLSGDMNPVKSGSYVLLSITDDGCGISEDNFTRIFDPFFTTDYQKGGLGLSAVYSIINSYHGYIVVKSELEVGSTFSVYLPSAEGISTETASDVIPTVFIAGFEQVEKQFLTRILSALGCTVVSVSDEAQIEENPPEDDDGDEFNILLIDYNLYMSEIDRFTDTEFSKKGLIAVIDESFHVPDDADPNILFMSRPTKLENVSRAVAAYAWMRPDDYTRIGDSED